MVFPEYRDTEGVGSPFDRRAYRRCNMIHRCVVWLKENRRLGTRFEKLAVNFLAMVKLAMIQRHFQILDSRDRM